MNAVFAQCYFASAGSFRNSEVVQMFFLTPGVLQGCPMSGWLFALVMDTILEALHKGLGIADPGYSIDVPCIRACADDIGAALKEGRDLKTLHATFAEVAHVSKLKTKPKKCQVVVLGAEAEKRTFETKRWIADCVPAWENMAVVRTAKYLGH